MRLNAPLMPPHASRAVQSLVTIALRIAANSADASCRAIVTDSGGVAAHLSSTRSAAARGTGSRPTTTTSTPRPAAASAAHSAACCDPHVRTSLTVSSSTCTNRNVARSRSSGTGSLWGK